MPSRFGLPHLTSEELSDRDLQERLLNSELLKCQRGDDFDAERADHVLSDYAVRIFKVVLAAYKTRSSFKNRWIEEIKHISVYRTLKVFAEHSFYGMPTLSDLEVDLRDAIEKHLKDTSQTIRLNAPESRKTELLPAFAAFGINPDPASPLLKSAMRLYSKHGKIPPQETKRGGRIARSIQSESAAKKLEAYLDAKGLSQTQFAIQIDVDPKTLYRFRTTGKLGKPVAQTIAQAMGLTLEELIAR